MEVEPIRSRMTLPVPRPTQLIAGLGAPWLVFAMAAAAATAPSVTVSPRTTRRGQAVKLRGAGWYVIEFCAPRVTLTLRRSPSLGPLLIARVPLRTGVRTSGTFSTSWIVPRSAHRGLRTILATQHCKSGRTGATVLVTRSTTIRVD
jgi:hypothetical protein